MTVFVCDSEPIACTCDVGHNYSVTVYAGDPKDAYCITSNARQAMKHRASMFHSTIDFERPYADIVEQRQIWVMENWLHWTETFSVVILQPYKQGGVFCEVFHDARVSSMWQSLRAIVFHFMRPMAEHAQETAVAQVQEHLRLYSRLVQEVFGPSACNYNLHMINCRSVSFTCACAPAISKSAHASEFSSVQHALGDCVV